MRDNHVGLVFAIAVAIALSSCGSQEDKVAPDKGANATLEAPPDVFDQDAKDPGSATADSPANGSGLESMPSGPAQPNVPEGAYRASGRPVPDQVLANEVRNWEHEQAAAPQAGPEHEVPPGTVVKSGQPRTYSAQDPTASH